MPLQSLEVSDLVELYRQAKKRFDEDAAFQETSRKEVVNLQVGWPDAGAPPLMLAHRL
jgi:arginyl-tRNA synthetase